MKIEKAQKYVSKLEGKKISCLGTIANIKNGDLITEYGKIDLYTLSTEELNSLIMELL